MKAFAQKTNKNTNSTAQSSILSNQSGLAIQRKCSCGNSSKINGSCQECKNKKMIGLQPKLKIGQSDDKYELEADRVADQVMRMGKPQTNDIRQQSRKIQPKPLIQRQAANARNDGTEAPAIVHDVLNTAGQPLGNVTRGYMESRFDHDFSQVRIHNDNKAAQSANAVSARAYTVGSDIVFGSGQYTPGTNDGDHLLAHELTHVVQQGGADLTLTAQGDPNAKDSTLEKHEPITTNKTASDIFPINSPKLSSGAMLQRAACPCCANSISISNVNQIDNARHMGHSFNAIMDLSYPASGPSGSCTLEWWERTNVPYTAGMSANTWTDMFALLPTSPTLAPWVNRTETCASSSPVTITDPPALGKRAGRTVTRTLDFRIVINSMPANSTAGCTNATQQVTATQVLTMVNGTPDWSASSFTTP